MNRSTYLNRSTRLKHGPWKRKPSSLWLAIERECPEIGKGILEAAERDEERAAEDFRRKYGSVERVRWVQGLPCVVSGEIPSVNAHVPACDGLPSGTARKEDACWIVPLAWGLHQELHQFGLATFEERHGVDLQDEARRIEAMWQERAL